MSLSEYLKNAEVESFTPRPYYSPEGDTLTYFAEDTEYYAQRIDDLVTVYLSVKNDALVGCKIKGVRRILDRLGEFGVRIDNGKVHLGAFFLAGMVDADKDKREQYERLGHTTRGVAIDIREIQPA